MLNLKLYCIICFFFYEQIKWYFFIHNTGDYVTFGNWTVGLLTNGKNRVNGHAIGKNRDETFTDKCYVTRNTCSTVSDVSVRKRSVWFVLRELIAEETKTKWTSKHVKTAAFDDVCRFAVLFEQSLPFLSPLFHENLAQQWYTISYCLTS